MPKQNSQEALIMRLTLPRESWDDIEDMLLVVCTREGVERFDDITWDQSTGLVFWEPSKEIAAQLRGIVYFSLELDLKGSKTYITPSMATYYEPSWVIGAAEPV